MARRTWLRTYSARCERILLGGRDARQGLEDAAEVAHADALLDQPAQTSVSRTRLTGLGTTLRTVAGANGSSSSSRRWTSAMPRKSAARARRSSRRRPADPGGDLVVGQRVGDAQDAAPAPRAARGRRTARRAPGRTRTRGAGSGTPSSAKTGSRSRMRHRAQPVAAPSERRARGPRSPRGSTARRSARTRGSRAPPPRARSMRRRLGAAAARRSAAARARAGRARRATSAAPMTRNGAAGRPGTAASRSTNTARDLQRLGHAEELPRELVAERRVRLLARHARHEDAGGRRQDERRDLRHEAVADREQPVALERVDRPACPRIADADGEAAERC